MAAKKITVPEFQAYLQSLADSDDTPDRDFELAASYAELQFRLHGGSRCPICRAHVRHVLPVTIEHQDGSTSQYPCLCTRCLQGEKVTAKRLSLRAGRTVLEYKK